MHLHVLTQLQRRELPFDHVRAQDERVEVRDSVQWLARLHYFSCLGVCGEHRTCFRIGDLALVDTVVDLRHVRGARYDFLRHALPLRPSCLYLRDERAIIPLRLIELLCRRRLLVEQPARAVERASGNRELRLIHTDLPTGGSHACLRGRALRDALRALEIELCRIDETDDGTAARSGGAGLS